MRDVEKEQEQLLNGTRFMVNTNESKGVFLRDVDKLMHQYRNLRLSVFNLYKDRLPDPISQEELRSYIDEQFVRLVKEYDINGPVDFPGYIKTKLHYRVKHSYIKGEHRDRKRVFIPKNDFDITNLLEKSSIADEELDYYEVLEYTLQDVKFSDLEREVLFYILQEMTDGQIEKKLKDKHKGEKISSHDIRDTIKSVQEFIRTRLEKALEE
ncbi:RNA polymerase sigma factor [Bacillus phage 015DV002]|nr:RNA polymerase sigma factor [Bacillus phage 000TH008]QQO40813.1 RNA polymerase sigma factor [Bacillus phage 000TH009]QQO41063.1 RNA polymerase sigma factor [Bacillus phage 015DV002]QQO41341.1 RNA polymerase sigma factor [Bacillus phage 015DV004]